LAIAAISRDLTIINVVDASRAINNTFRHLPLSALDRLKAPSPRKRPTQAPVVESNE
jgi:hypothetical protein